LLAVFQIEIEHVCIGIRMGRTLKISADVKLDTNQVVLRQQHVVTNAQIAAHRAFGTRFFFVFAFRLHVFFESGDLPRHRRARRLIKLLEVWIVAAGELRILRVDLVHQFLVALFDRLRRYLDVASESDRLLVN